MKLIGERIDELSVDMVMEVAERSADLPAERPDDLKV